MREIEQELGGGQTHFNKKLVELCTNLNDAEAVVSITILVALQDGAQFDTRTMTGTRHSRRIAIPIRRRR